MKTYLRLIILIIAVTVAACSKNVIEAPVFPPPAVEGLTATPGNGQVTLNWTSGNPKLFNSYALSYSPGDGTAISIPNTESTFTVNGLLNDTEYTFTLVAIKESQGTMKQSSDPAIIKATPFEPDTDGVELASFRFLAANNPDMALEEDDVKDLTGAIDLENNAVTFGAEDVSAYIYLDALVASFDVPAGTVVSVNGEEQVSGVTVQDFTSPVIYTLTADGITRTYTITVTKNQYATIPDDNFRAFLAGLGMPFNAQEQLHISSPMVTQYETNGKINLDNQGIRNIKGIEFFVGTKEIDAERNNFPSINVSRNVGLKNLLIGINPDITSLETGNLTGLEIFYMNGATSLTNEDVQPIIDANPGLKRFFAYSVGMSLTSVTVDNLTKLEQLRLNQSIAKGSAASINALLAKDPPIAANPGNLRVYIDETGEQCGSYDPATYECL